VIVNSLMTILNLEMDSERIKTNQDAAKYLGKSSLSSKVIVHSDTHPLARHGPLKWLMITATGSTLRGPIGR